MPIHDKLAVELCMLNRRQLIQAGVVSAGAIIAGSSNEVLAQTSSTRAPDLRIAHLTDMHVMPDGALGVNAESGFAKALEAAQSLARKPDLILQGGDAIMDALRTGKGDVTAQWAAFKRTLEKVKTPIHHAIGNHDCWTGPGSAGDPLKGKAWALQQLGLKKPYYSFDSGAWHFVVLDSTNLETKTTKEYSARLDEAQFKWLEADLKSVSKTKPVLVLSHIPILAVCAYFDGDNEKSGDWLVPGAWMHNDARRIKDLFLKHPNVKLCLSGHIHLRDSLEYNGVTYACNGAVCGNWWQGNYQETKPGYAIVDLWNDGSHKIEYVTY
jgi:3',5'-cyclic-AMP phosphodiesterase